MYQYKNQRCAGSRYLIIRFSPGRTLQNLYPQRVETNLLKYRDSVLLLSVCANFPSHENQAKPIKEKNEKVGFFQISVLVIPFYGYTFFAIML